MVDLAVGVVGVGGDTGVGVGHLGAEADCVIRIGDRLVGRVGHGLFPVERVVGSGVRAGGILDRNPVIDGSIDQCRPCAVGVQPSRSVGRGRCGCR